ncbi:peptidylprolyl isomerase [Histomonas meleagridis]|uniref:peptidylprolyl isomerase n=1 Tax=Histomonas meleagridis TaxID=135588 RepID=UPI0035596BEF|nr:peptidylprolyl isomerase [Histomonas meleagridis]KAH0802008.1 peptidylprolyl isomerase [Histomonas meleagridis]
MFDPQSIPLTDDGLLTKKILKEGTGPQPKDGDRVRVHYEGRLNSNNKKFESTRATEKPFEFTIGQRVITGWSIGVKSMKVGEISLFRVDPKYGYGNLGKQPDIPPDATLIFEIELLEILVGPTKQELAVAKATDECEQGNVAFREGRLEDAINLYSQGRLTLLFEGKDDSDPSYFSDAYAQIKLRLNRNLSVSYAKSGDYEQSLHYAQEVLDFVPNDLKMLVRKIDAEIHLHKIVDARQTLTKAMGYSHNDPALRTFREQIEKLEKEDRIRRDQTFKMMTKKE